MTSSSTLPLTGERTVPGHDRESYWFARHEAVYLWTARELREDVAPHDVVVDAGCGEGYGADILRATLGATVVGVDYDEATAAHVRTAYPQVHMVRANLAELPLVAASCQAVVSLQVIEHLWDLGHFLRSCHRCVRPGGALVVSTPNRPVFSPGVARGAKPTNPFHVEEFDAEQVSGMLAAAGFAKVDVRGLHHGARLRAWEEQHGSLVTAQVKAALTGVWPDDLEEMVQTVTAADFDVADIEAAHDLIGIGWR